MPSPSSRRAWIEIQLLAHKLLRKAVALLAEGVDRNLTAVRMAVIVEVALLAEGVDRNSCPAIRLRHWKSRPPRGGRG